MTSDDRIAIETDEVLGLRVHRSSLTPFPATIIHSNGGYGDRHHSGGRFFSVEAHRSRLPLVANVLPAQVEKRGTGCAHEEKKIGVVLQAPPLSFSSRSFAGMARTGAARDRTSNHEAQRPSH